jgi:hypothetical protein
LHKIRRKDRNFPIFFGRTTKIGLILAVRVNEGLGMFLLTKCVTGQQCLTVTNTPAWFTTTLLQV